MTSLHVKYRPTTFDEVLGQDAVVKSLRQVVKNRRAKCFLLTGPSGTGKTTLARILAKEFAGTAGTPLNLEEVDGASKSGKDDAKELVTRSLYRALGGSTVKFIVVDECHLLSAQAWAALLKPTEEPPEHVYYGFCTTDPSKVPKAIITRCLRYDLKPVKEELLLDLLIKVVDAEGIQLGDDIIEAIAEASMGSPRQALVFLEACVSCKSISDAHAIIRVSLQSKEVIDLARWLAGGKGFSWKEAIRHVKAIEGQDAEGIRIQLVNYFAAILLNSSSDEKAKPLLRLVELFGEPYNSSDKLAPLLHSLGLALNLDK